MSERIPVSLLRFPQTVFRETGDFAARDAAERWCSQRGVSVGRAQRGAPCGLLYGEFDIQKWRNLRSGDRAALDGIMVGDLRDGPVTVYLKAPQ